MNAIMEHALDRLERLGLSGKIIDHEDGYFYKRKGKGNRYYWYSNPITILNKCQYCGFISTPKKVHCRNDIYGWDRKSKYDYSPSKNILCTSCWNKIKPLVKREKESDSIRLFINQIKKEIGNERKNQNNR